jgi:hypothetical protein
MFVQGADKAVVHYSVGTISNLNFGLRPVHDLPARRSGISSPYNSGMRTLLNVGQPPTLAATPSAERA